MNLTPSGAGDGTIVLECTVFYAYCLLSIYLNLSINFWINVILKHCVNNLSIFLNIIKNEGVNFLNYNCKLINTGLKICFNLSSFWINYFGCSYLDNKSLRH